MASILEIWPVSSLKKGAMELWEKGQKACVIYGFCCPKHQCRVFLSLMAIERPHFHNILLLIFSLKILFSKDSHEVFNWELGG